MLGLESTNISIWIGDKSYAEEELLAMLKEDIKLLSCVIDQLEAEREAKLRACHLVSGHLFVSHKLIEKA